MSKPKKNLHEHDHVNPCRNCTPIHGVAPMEKVIAVGFGAAYVTRNGEQIYDGEAAIERDEDPWTFADAEKAAVGFPGKWRVHLYGPLHGEVYERKKPGEWVLVEKDNGFA